MRHRVRRLFNRLLPLQRGAVLLYHRVSDLASDPQLLAVSPKNFRDHLVVLNERYRPTTLARLAIGSDARRRGNRQIAVTFDDGYADNLHNALPLLRDAKVPATVFVTAGRIGDPGLFWWDDLERVLLTTRSLPALLQLNVGPTSFRWPIAANEVADARWDVLSDQNPTSRQKAYLDLCELVRPLPTPVRDALLNTIRTWASVELAGDPKDRAVTTEEVVRLASEPLISIGAHSMTHPLLAAQSVADQREEIQSSKRVLEQLLPVSVESFAYPFGAPAQYSRTTVKLVKEAGFAYACANFAAEVGWATSRYEIPRFIARNWTGEEFAARLAAVLGE